MRYRLSLAVSALFASLAISTGSAFAQSSSEKVLASSGAGFNTASVQALLNSGDAAVAAGNLAEAREDYDNARDASKQLLAFYRDLSGAFRGLDARIPREMDLKGRQALVMLAQADLRLAALFRQQNQPEVAVPVLVEVVRLMTPSKPEGQKAYQSLLELGFVETPYAGAKAPAPN